MKVVTSTPLWLGLFLAGIASLGQGSFWRGLLAGGIVAGVASLSVMVVKFAVRRARPSMAYSLLKTLDRYSFPSGHSCTAFAVAIGVLFLAPLLFPVALALAAVVAFSRVYLGVHYPSDVLTGAAMGVVLGAATFASNLVTEFVGLLGG
ncbi:MAG: phosphatase PAP2 family protein [Myxococcota bacterium]